ncbi:hypothetical protein Tco_1290938 [Tanacetum coccineum]
MLVERRYPLSKELLQRMLDLGLEVKRESNAALHLVKFIKHKNWLVHKQTACGKDFSNPFMVDNLPKIVGFSTHLASLVKSWLVQDQTVLALASPKANELTIPEQTATGKGTSNPFMAGSLPKTTKPTIMHDSKTFNNVFYALKEDLIYATEFKIQEMISKGQPTWAFGHPKDAPMDIDAYSDSDYLVLSNG